MCRRGLGRCFRKQDCSPAYKRPRYIQNNRPLFHPRPVTAPRTTFNFPRSLGATTCVCDLRSSASIEPTASRPAPTAHGGRPGRGSPGLGSWVNPRVDRGAANERGRPLRSIELAHEPSAQLSAVIAARSTSLVVSCRLPRAKAQGTWGGEGGRTSSELYQGTPNPESSHLLTKLVT